MPASWSAWRVGEISTKEYRVNEQIRVPEVRVIDHEGKQLGVIPTRQAMSLAAERGLDLVEVAPNAAPPVCRIVDFGKFIYQRARREREARKAQKTGEYDLEHKMKDARRFIGHGDKVRMRVVFRGREVTHMDMAREMLIKLAGQLTDIATVEQPPAIDGRTLSVVLAPLKTH
jgi:translation initiation factor IF-3